MPLSDSHREQIAQTRAAHRQPPAKPTPVPRQIGDRDPVTGQHKAIYPDGSETASGRKLYDAHANKGDTVTGLRVGDGTVGLLGPKGQLSPLAQPEQEGVRGIATQGPLKDNNVGYLNGQVWNYEEPPIEEVAFQFVLAAIRENSQPYTFKAGTKTKEISFANRDRLDLAGRGEIDLKANTVNRKLKLEFEAEIDGTKPTDVSCVFYVSKPQRLQTTITCTSTVEAIGAIDNPTGLPAPAIYDLYNYLILNQIKLPEASELNSLDATNFVDVTAPLPSTSSGFTASSLGEFEGEKIKGTLPKATIASGDNGGFIFIFTAFQPAFQSSFYTYKTTFTFTFK